MAWTSPSPSLPSEKLEAFRSIQKRSEAAVVKTHLQQQETTMDGGATTASAAPMVVIPADRLAAMETEIALLKERLAKRTHHNISSLRAYDAANPDKKAERSRLSKEKNRDAYNARRRELRRLKKIGEGGDPSTGTE